jgi:hypothetical protein
LATFKAVRLLNAPKGGHVTEAVTRDSRPREALLADLLSEGNYLRRDVLLLLLMLVLLKRRHIKGLGGLSAVMVAEGWSCGEDHRKRVSRHGSGYLHGIKTTRERWGPS